MTNRMPSLAALLGLVAVAGYQNRERIGEYLKGLDHRDLAGMAPGGAASPARPEQSTDMIGSGYGGNSILGSIGDLIDHFRSAGQEKVANSWVSTGPNEPIEQDQLEKALGPELMERLSHQTGFSRDELLRRLSTSLPDAIDQLTPEGRAPRG